MKLTQEQLEAQIKIQIEQAYKEGRSDKGYNGEDVVDRRTKIIMDDLKTLLELRESELVERIEKLTKYKVKGSDDLSIYGGAYNKALEDVINLIINNK